MYFCEYKNIFGEVNKGIHSFRILNIAIVDLFLTILLAYIISKYTRYNFFIIFSGLILLGIILHRIFCVNTTINKLIFGIVS